MAKEAPEIKRKFSLKRYLLTGLLVWLPIVVTLWVISYIISLSDGLVAMLPIQWQPKVLVGHDVPGFGLIIAVLVLFFTGVFGGNVLGRKIIQAWDGMMGASPSSNRFTPVPKKCRNRCYPIHASHSKPLCW